MQVQFAKNLQYYKFCFYGFFKNLRFFDAFLILFFLDKGINFLEIGLIYSAREITILIMEIPSGLISDAIGRRKTLIISFFVYILSFIAFYYASNVFTLLIAMVVFAFADAFRSGVHKAMIFQYLKVQNWSSQKVDYYGNTRSWSQTGSAISSLIAAGFVFYYEQYNIIFIASIIPYLANMALIYSYPKYLDGEVEQISGKKIAQKFALVKSAAMQTIWNLNFLKILTNLTLYTGYYKAVKDYIQPLLKYTALSMPFFAYLNNEKKIAIITGVIYFILYLLTALSSKFSGNFMRLFIGKQNQSQQANNTSVNTKPNKVSGVNWQPLNLTLLGGLVIGLLTGAWYSFGYYALPILGFVLIMIIENLRKPIGVGLVADVSKDESMATVLSITSQAKSIFAAIIAPIIGLIADVSNPGMGIVITSIVLLIGVPFYLLNSKNK